MRAVVLAAGRGSRMGGRTDDRPKCMVELGGRTLLSLQLAALRAGGANEVAVVRGYRAESIDLPELSYFDNPRWEETNMVMSLATASSWLSSSDVIVSYADIFYGADLVRRLIRAPGDLVVAYDRDWLKLWSRRFADPLSDAETFRIDASGRLLDIGRKTGWLSDIGGQYMGLLKFTPAAWRAVELALEGLPATDRDRLDMTSLLQRLLAKEQEILTVETRGHWGEVDQTSDLDLYESMISSGELLLRE